MPEACREATAENRVSAASGDGPANEAVEASRAGPASQASAGEAAPDGARDGNGVGNGQRMGALDRDLEHRKRGVEKEVEHRRGEVPHRHLVARVGRSKD